MAAASPENAGRQSSSIRPMARTAPEDRRGGSSIPLASCRPDGSSGRGSPPSTVATSDPPPPAKRPTTTVPLEPWASTGLVPAPSPADELVSTARVPDSSLMITADVSSAVTSTSPSAVVIFGSEWRTSAHTATARPNRDCTKSISCDIWPNR